MNLVTEPWLPVTDSGGTLCYISLEQLFKQPEEWRDLVLRPHERVSVMRLLICIVQASLNGPEDIDEWNECLDEIPSVSLAYLEKWKGSFGLYDNKNPFMQIPDLEPFNKEPTPIAKLSFSLATGNNTTLFDHGAIYAERNVRERMLEDSNLIISMLAFNNFSLCGLYPQATWKGVSTSKTGVKDSPCASQSMLHCFVRKNTLIKTLHANVLTLEQITDRYGDSHGVPVWEMYPQLPNDNEAIENATETYLGRLVPLSRWIKILQNKTTMLMGEGFSYEVYPNFTEATAVEVVRKVKEDSEYYILGCKTTTPWRELGALTTERKIAGKVGGAAAIENQPKSEGYDLQILALKRDKASVLDTFESVLYVQSIFLTSEQNRMSYTEGVKKAERQSYKLNKAIQKYLSFMYPNLIEVVAKGLNGDKLTKKENEKYRVIKTRAKEKYLVHFWTLIEKNKHLLIEYISLLGTDQDEVREQALTVWKQAIDHAARETYTTLCTQESPRQIRAYVAGWQLLYPSAANQEAS